MKTKKTELEVDILGGQGPLTIAEEKALSEYFQKRKLVSVRQLTKTMKRKTNQVKVSA